MNPFEDPIAVVATIGVAGTVAGVAIGAWTTWRTVKTQITARADELGIQLRSERERDERQARIAVRIDVLTEMRNVLSSLLSANRANLMNGTKMIESVMKSRPEGEPDDEQITALEAAQKIALKDIGEFRTSLGDVNESITSLDRVGSGNADELLSELVTALVNNLHSATLVIVDRLHLVMNEITETEPDSAEQIRAGIILFANDLRAGARIINRRIENLLTGVPNTDPIKDAVKPPNPPE